MNFFNFTKKDYDYIVQECMLDEEYQRLPHYSTTVGELCEEYPNCTLLVTMPNHITIIDKGIVYGTFDCRNRRFWACWLVE